MKHIGSHSTRLTRSQVHQHHRRGDADALDRVHAGRRDKSAQYRDADGREFNGEVVDGAQGDRTDRSRYAFAGAYDAEAVFAQSISQQTLFARLAGCFGVLAVVLIATGLYGTLAYRVSRRSAEIGVRMALGAKRSQVVWMVLRGSLLLRDRSGDGCAARYGFREKRKGSLFTRV
jgi:hypothetical protein